VLGEDGGMAGVKKMKARGGGKGKWIGEKSLEIRGMERWIASLLRVPGRGALTGKGRQQASHDLDHKKKKITARICVMGS
jgi:hypothetical protein